VITWLDKVRACTPAQRSELLDTGTTVSKVREPMPLSSWEGESVLEVLTGKEVVIEEPLPLPDEKTGDDEDCSDMPIPTTPPPGHNISIDLTKYGGSPFTSKILVDGKMIWITNQLRGSKGEILDRMRGPHERKKKGDYFWNARFGLKTKISRMGLKVPDWKELPVYSLTRKFLSPELATRLWNDPKNGWNGVGLKYLHSQNLIKIWTEDGPYKSYNEDNLNQGRPKVYYLGPSQITTVPPAHWTIRLDHHHKQKNYTFKQGKNLREPHNVGHVDLVGWFK